MRSFRCVFKRRNLGHFAAFLRNVYRHRRTPKSPAKGQIRPAAHFIRVSRRYALVNRHSASLIHWLFQEDFTIHLSYQVTKPFR